MRTLRRERSTVTLTRWLVSLENLLRDCRRSSAHKQGADPSEPWKNRVCVHWIVTPLLIPEPAVLSHLSSHECCLNLGKGFCICLMFCKILHCIHCAQENPEKVVSSSTFTFLSSFFGECSMVNLSLSIPLFLPMLNLFLSKYLPSFHLVYWAELPSCILRS